MRVINQSWGWVQKPNTPLEIIERAGRTCYKSEAAISPESAASFVKKILSHDPPHESVIEHASASVRFITNRGVTHELVRHRLAAFSQESTRYVRYNDDMEFIRPVWETGAGLEHLWLTSILNAETTYQRLLFKGWPPQQAREVLPNSLKTEIVMTANLREWRHVFKLRTAKAAHPQMRALMIDCLAGFKKEIPVIFDDILTGEA